MKDCHFIVSELLNNETSSPEEMEKYLIETTKGYKIKELLKFWYEYGHRVYVYLCVKKPMGNKDLAGLSLIIAEMYVESLVEAYEIRKEKE